MPVKAQTKTISVNEAFGIEEMQHKGSVCNEEVVPSTIKVVYIVGMLLSESPTSYLMVSARLVLLGCNC